MKNPINTIFSLKLQYGLGTIENASLSQASQFISLLGTKEKTFNVFKEELQKIGSKIETYSNSNYFGFNVSGFDSYFNQTLELLNEFISTMHVRENDKEKLNKLIENSKITRDRELKDPATAGRALRDYVMYGKKSPYLRRSTLSEVQKMTPEFLIEQVKKAMKYEVDILYTGTINKQEVINYINTTLDISSNLIKTSSPITIDYKKYSRNIRCKKSRFI